MLSAATATLCNGSDHDIAIINPPVASIAQFGVCRFRWIFAWKLSSRSKYYEGGQGEKNLPRSRRKTQPLWKSQMGRRDKRARWKIVIEEAGAWLLGEIRFLQLAYGGGVDFWCEYAHCVGICGSLGIDGIKESYAKLAIGFQRSNPVSELAYIL